MLGDGGHARSQPALNLTVSGTLASGSDQAPRIALNRDVAATAVRVQVKQPPTGADLTVNILLDTTLWMTLVIAAGTTSVWATAGQIAAAATIFANTNIRLDLTGVGTTFPGADLSASIYL